MNPYRIALIFCRALIINLWWSAGLSVLTGIIAALIAQSGLLGTSAMPFALNGFIGQGQSSVPTVICAVALMILAPTLSAAMTGLAMLEGETISSRRGLESHERALASAGAGLMLLVFGLMAALPAIVGIGYEILSGSVGTGTGSSIMHYYSAVSLVGGTLRCGVGILLAFRLGLRRIVQSP